MLRTLDASKLALTKLRTRKIRLAATIIVAGPAIWHCSVWFDGATRQHGEY